MNQKYKTQIFQLLIQLQFDMMPSSNGNIFPVTGLLCGGGGGGGGRFIGHRWIPHTKASDAELWCFLLSVVPEQTVEQTIEMLVIWDVIALIMVSL